MGGWYREGVERPRRTLGAVIPVVTAPLALWVGAWGAGVWMVRGAAVASRAPQGEGAEVEAGCSVTAGSAKVGMVAGGAAVAGPLVVG